MRSCCLALLDEIGPLEVEQLSDLVRLLKGSSVPLGCELKQSSNRIAAGAIGEFGGDLANVAPRRRRYLMMRAARHGELAGQLGAKSWRLPR